MKLDPKIITWAIVTPLTPQTSRFKTILKRWSFKNQPMGKGNYLSHFPNIEAAKQAVESVSNLGTNFSVLYINDEQFGQIKINYSKG